MKYDRMLEAIKEIEALMLEDKEADSLRETSNSTPELLSITFEFNNAPLNRQVIVINKSKSPVMIKKFAGIIFDITEFINHYTQKRIEEIENK